MIRSRIAATRFFAPPPASPRRLLRSRLIALLAGAAVATVATVARAQPFSYMPPGQLVPGSGEGRVDEFVYAPGMRFPIESAPAFANSQVWGVGGSQGPAGSQCDVANFSYPWWDNYCETRQWDMPLCPAGIGHQGQDIRASTCDANVHWVVAAADGTVTNIGSYSVYITGADGTRYDYLHMGSVQVTEGQDVAKGQHIGKVSNEFGGTPTTVHLHFNLRQNVDGVGVVYVPTYMSLVTSYEALIGPQPGPPVGALDSVDCAGIEGWAVDPDVPDDAAHVLLAFDGPAGPGVTEAELVADRHRDDLCGSLGSCTHGFSSRLPVSLLDGEEHALHAYGIDGQGDGDAELDQSPGTFTCPLQIPTGVRRSVSDDAFSAWAFSAFWDTAEVDSDVIDPLPEGPALPAQPRLIQADGSPEIWVVDGPFRRLVANAATADAWGFDVDAAEAVSDSEIDALVEAPPLRTQPFLLRDAASAETYLLDSELPDGPGSSGAPAGGSGKAAAPEGDSGCACRAASSSSSLGLGLAAAGFALAVARRRRTSSC